MLDFEPRNTYEVEVTDTFGGEANYCWVNRYEFSLPLNDAEGHAARKAYDRRIVAEAKRLAGWTGLKCATSPMGCGFEVRPVGRTAPCWIMFINYKD
jgi:hypothetical protein